MLTWGSADQRDLNQEDPPHAPMVVRIIKRVHEKIAIGSRSDDLHFLTAPAKARRRKSFFLANDPRHSYGNSKKVTPILLPGQQAT